jgi:hypothetical protein
MMLSPLFVALTTYIGTLMPSGGSIHSIKVCS